MNKKKRFSAAYDSYMDIHNSMESLSKNLLTLAEYDIVYEMLIEMSDCKTESKTVIKAVAEWFARHDFHVTQKGIGWTVSL